MIGKGGEAKRGLAITPCFVSSPFLLAKVAMRNNCYSPIIGNETVVLYRQLLDNYAFSLKAANRSVRTITWYQEILLRFFSFLEAQGLARPVQELGTEELKAYIVHLQDTTKWANRTYIKEAKGRLSPYSIQGHVRAIKAFFSWLEREECIESNPMVRLPLPKVPQYLVKILTVDQIKTLLSMLDRQTPLGMKYYVILLLLLDTGMRISELVQVEIDDIDLIYGHIRVMGKGQKERIVPFCNQTRRELLRYMKHFRPHLGPEDGAYVFPQKDGDHISINSVQQFLRRLAAKAGLHGVKCSPLIFRHYFASQAIANEANVFTLKDIMGHASLQTTLKYTHMQSGDLKAQHSKFSPVAGLFKN